LYASFIQGPLILPRREIQLQEYERFTLLVIPHSLAHSSAGLLDYENVYPTDAYGDETGPNARVWKTYLDECHNYDEEQMNGWRESIDMLMIFVCAFDTGQDVHS
jgi:hypothetical protein